MRVKKIAVKGLFGLFDHEIPVHSAERVTIIHGPNGFGKTVMLRMIAGLAEGDPSIFETTPFSEFRLTLQDDTARVIRHREGSPTAEATRLEFAHIDSIGNVSSTQPFPAVTEISDAVLDRIDDLVPGPLRRSEQGWRDSSTGRRYSLAEVLRLHPAAVAAVPRRLRNSLFFKPFADLHVFFVETNRLGAVPSPSPSEVELAVDEFTGGPMYHPTGRHRSRLRVEAYSEDLVRRIKSMLADYAKHSQERDRTFPERLVRFARERQRTLAEREILGQMTDLEAKRRRLISLGFLDSETGLRDLTEDDIRRAAEALTIYVADVQEKLKVFDDMAQRIGKLMDIVNDRFRYKKLRIDREQGFRVLDNSDKSVDLEDLSSGEQHELVVLYELLFRVPEAGFVLVDEPEISLHVLWQSRFLTDLIEILELTNAYAVVATHSPVIIGNRWDLAVELKGP